MKIGMEKDAVEDLDREERRAIAAAVQARFGPGDEHATFAEVERLARVRIALHAQHHCPMY